LTPIPEDRAEPNFSNSSIIREHSYRLSSHRVTGVFRNQKTSFKSKNIVKQINPKRKFFTKQQLSIATLTLHLIRRLQNTHEMLWASRRRTFPTMTVFWSRTRRRSYSLNFLGELTRRQSSTYLDMLLEKYAVFFIV